MLLTTKEYVLNVSSAMFSIVTTNVKSSLIIAFSPMRMVFVQNVRTATILMKLNNVNHFLKIVCKLINWVSVLSAGLDFNFLLENAPSGHPVDQTWIVLNKMTKVNAQNVGTFILWKRVNAYPQERIHSVIQTHASAELANASNVKMVTFWTAITFVNLLEKIANNLVSKLESVPHVMSISSLLKALVSLNLFKTLRQSI